MTVNGKLSIQAEPPDTPESIALIGALDEHLNRLYPPENRHGLSVAALLDPSVTFLVARIGGVAVGCGAVKFVGGEYAEIKRMYVLPEWRGHGIAQALLAHLEWVVHQSGLNVLRLETGIHQPEAVRLYELAGFTRCAAFGDYSEDGISLCYEKILGATEEKETQMSDTTLTGATVMCFVSSAKPDEAMRFYGETLGLEFLVDNGYSLAFRVGSTATLRVQKVSELNPQSFTVFGWQVDNIDDAVTNLMARSVVFERSDMPTQDARGISTFEDGDKVAWFKDPDGNILSIAQIATK